MSGLPDPEPDVQPETTLVTMPALGLPELAKQLYPDDISDQAKMKQHVQDLFTLNADRLRNDTSFISGQIVKIPILGEKQ